jgi:hypothetical protein
MNDPGTVLIAALALGGVTLSVAYAAPPSRVEVGDPETGRPRRVVHDAVSAVVEAKDGGLVTTVRFRRPLIDGTFQCVHAYVDCDADEATGIRGAEVWARGSVGSRFQRTRAPAPAEGVPAPAALLRASWSRPFAETLRGQAPGGLQWINSARLDPAVVSGDALTFRLPVSVLVDRGLRYNPSVRVRLEVEGSCSQHPLAQRYTCADEGTAIRVDGADDDWSGQPRTDRTPGSMHPDAAEVEIASMSVDHDATHVYVLLRLSTAGFLDRSVDDVADEDQIVVGLEPLGGGSEYMDYQEVVVFPGKPQSTRPDAPAFAVGPRLVEVSIPRRPEQTSFRVLAWSDARRRDKIPDSGWIEVGVPPEALRPPSGRPR